MKEVSTFHIQILGGETKTKTYVFWIVILGPRQTPLNLVVQRLSFLYPFNALGLWMSHREAAATDAVPMRFLESSWPLFTSAAGHLDRVSEQQACIETSMVFVLMCTQAWGPQASLELFLTLPPCFSVSLLGRRPFVNDEEDRGFELCFSPTVKGGLWALAAWSVQRNMSFLFSTLWGKWGRPTDETKKTNKLGQCAARTSNATKATPRHSSERWEEQTELISARRKFLVLRCLWTN